jgi:mannose-1-phosphate guanylyltransferase
MEAIILAGGFGTRLRPLTYTRAKSLLPILNKPMIIHLIDSLPSEVDKVILAVNYRKDQIEEYFSKNNCGKEIIINNEKTPLGTGGATKFAEKHITDRFFVLNSDIICSINLDKMINFHKKNNSVTTISLWPVDNVSEFGVADVKDDGNIIRFVEKPKPKNAPSNLINAGAYLLEPEILDYIETGRLVSMEKEIFPKIIKKTSRFYGFKFDGYWMDIGRISSYLLVNKFLLENKKLDVFKGINCKINGVLKKSSIGNNVYIGNNTDINESIVFDNVKIGNNVLLSYCVIGENSEINEGCKLKNVVIGDNEKIKEKTILENTLIWTQPKPNDYPDKQIGNPIIN